MVEFAISGRSKKDSICGAGDSGLFRIILCLYLCQIKKYENLNCCSGNFLAHSVELENPNFVLFWVYL